MTKSIINRAFGLIIPIVLIGCAKEVDSAEQQPLEQEQENLHEVVFHAGWAPETKTVLQEDGSVWWSPGDEISLFVGSGENGGYKLTSTNTAPAATVDFIGHIGGSGSFTAMYPYNETAYCIDGLIVSTIQDVQYAKPGTFADGQLISIANSDNDNLYFYNICGGIKFSVANEGITKVVISSSKSLNTPYDYPIAGHVVASFSANGDVHSGIQTDGEESCTITVFPRDGDSFIPGQYYYVAIVPTEIPQLEVTYYKGDSFATFIFDIFEIGGNWPSIERATIKTLAEKDRNLTFLEADKKYTIISAYDFWPIGVDERRAITKVNFHTNCSELKGAVIRSSDGHSGYYPASVERNGTVIDFYTEADVYIPLDCGGLFQNFSSLTELDLSMFATDKTQAFHAMFYGCTNLRKLNISNFSSRGVIVDQDPFSSLFCGCYKILSLDLGPFELKGNAVQSMLGFARISHNCAIRCTPETREILSGAQSKLGLNIDYITWILPDEDIPDIEPYEFDYYSTDFSKDKTVKVLQEATMGNGINIVLLGDGYSDRMIIDGSYDNDMRKAMNAIFKDEPYASFREYFNVYAVYAVSENELGGSSNTAFYSYFGDFDPVNGPLATCDGAIVNQYATIPDNNIDETCIILIVNQSPTYNAGVADMLHIMGGDDIDDVTDYSKGGALAMVSRQLEDEYFSYVVAHEFGHGFAKLADEYCPYGGEMEDWEKDFYMDYSARYGWWSNIDFTDNPATIKWSRFLTDERYTGTGVGIFEGCNSTQGNWRSSQQSIMNNDMTGMFNAPSREAIYKRIHRLAFGKEWQYDYEAFVEYDQKNIAAEKAALAAPLVSRPPVFEINGKPFMKIEKSVTPDGKERIRVIMN